MKSRWRSQSMSVMRQPYCACYLTYARKESLKVFSTGQLAERFSKKSSNRLLVAETAQTPNISNGTAAFVQELTQRDPDRCS